MAEGSLECSRPRAWPSSCTATRKMSFPGGMGMIMRAAWVPSLRLPAFPPEASFSHPRLPVMFSTPKATKPVSSLFWVEVRGCPGARYQTQEDVYERKLRSHLGCRFSQELEVTFAWKRGKSLGSQLLGKRGTRYKQSKIRILLSLEVRLGDLCRPETLGFEVLGRGRRTPPHPQMIIDSLQNK